jgi:hypothetical protein
LATKIKAYTLSEVLVVLLLTSILAGMAFSVLSMVQRQLFSIQKNIDVKANFKQLEQSLLITMNRHAKLKYNTSENTLYCYSEIDTVRYVFTKEYVKKSTDTFFVSNIHKKLFFEGKETNEGLIDAIKVDSVGGNSNLKLFLFTHNDAKTYMK